ncbi:MAG: hypothetical protein KC502_19745 [Myxococcales bacterium]|nr:hypothetical protein [Myxococcales bacterium]
MQSDYTGAMRARNICGRLRAVAHVITLLLTVVGAQAVRAQQPDQPATPDQTKTTTPAVLPAPVAVAPPAMMQPMPEPQPMRVAPTSRLSSYERSILMRGPISSGSYVLGGLLGTWMGFGIGHAVQGRYSDGGGIFTLGQVVGLGVGLTGMIRSIESRSCEFDVQGNAFCGSGRNEDMWTAIGVSGFVLYAAVRVWEIIDLWASPPRVNEEYRRVRRKADGLRWTITPAVLPNGGMMLAGARF